MPRQVAQYYQLDDFKAHVWIAHQRYPTKGRVWHPGGAHPFIGLDEALVHNGDFANYYSVSEYLYQRNIVPLFLTDTEVSVQVFDLLNRVYGYPLEYIIESLAPTTEMDFDKLPPEKQKDLSADPDHSDPRFSGRALVFHHCPQSYRAKNLSVDRHHRYGHAPAPGLCPAKRRGGDRTDLLGKTGHRCHPAVPGQGRCPVRHRCRPLLECPGGQLYRRRGLYFYGQGIRSRAMESVLSG